MRAAKDAKIHVAPDGNDSWSGSLASPNSVRTDGPVATVGRAQKLARELKAASKTPRTIRILLRAGHYFLRSPLKLGPKDSGVAKLDRNERLLSPECPLVFCAHRREKAVISGGRVLKGWRIERVGDRAMWVTRVPEVKSGKWDFAQLFVNGHRRVRPRLPRNGYFRIEKLPGLRRETPLFERSDRFVYRTGDIRPWHNIGDVEVVVMNFWSEARSRIKSIDKKRRMLVMESSAGFRMTDEHSMKGAQYYVENIFEEIRPGEWYLDRRSAKLYYCPLMGEKLHRSQIIAPRLTHLVSIEGNEKQAAQRIRFEGITFSHTEWRHPQRRSSLGQAAIAVPGAVSLKRARHCSFSLCTFTNLGTYALELSDCSSDIVVEKSVMSDLGAGGVRIWHGCTRNTVADCDIGPLGLIYHSASGVVIAKSSGNKIVHNEIHHTGYTGISLGWTWGYAEGACYGNVIEHNHIHDIGRGMLSDLGGIYVLGHSQGSRVRFNVFHDIVSRGYGGWAIYNDEGATDLLIESNLAYGARSMGFGAWGAGGKTFSDPGFDTRSSVFHQHYGRDNTIRNNIFAFGQDAQIALSRPEVHCSFEMTNNIFYFDSGALFTGNWKGAGAVFANNVYFDTRRKPIRFPGGVTLRERQVRGTDKGSMIADPKFVAPKKGDFRLRKNSPALKLGFKEFDYSTAGPRHYQR